jgi:hypothetical protein
MLILPKRQFFRSYELQIRGWKKRPSGLTVELGKIKLDYVRVVRKSSKIIPPGVDAMNVHNYCFMSTHKYESRLILLACTNIYKFGENVKL